MASVWGDLDLNQPRVHVAFVRGVRSSVVAPALENATAVDLLEMLYCLFARVSNVPAGVLYSDGNLVAASSRVLGLGLF